MKPMTEYEVPKGKQAKMREQADAETTDRKMKEAAKRHQKTRVGGGKREKDDIPKYAKGGKVRGCGMAKRGVRKPKMY